MAMVMGVLKSWLTMAPEVGAPVWRVEHCSTGWSIGWAIVASPKLAKIDALNMAVVSCDCTLAPAEGALVI